MNEKLKELMELNGIASMTKPDSEERFAELEEALAALLRGDTD